MTDLLNLSYISLYSVQHQEDWFLGIGIVISHAYGVAKQYADNFAEFIIHVTVQCLASGKLFLSIGILIGHTYGVIGLPNRMPTPCCSPEYYNG